ncbi:hypothetical protein TL16_g11618 [Triparma laevis f. inornata]|nr:hypothetical protein TL16_g11618 [Triparma laevis f. inornata]
MSSAYIPKALLYTFAAIAPPSLTFYLYSSSTRSNHISSLQETALPSSVVTIGDMYVDSAAPGDVLMFKRRCHTCVTPLAALACLAQQAVLKKDTYDHFGIVVPGETTYSTPKLLEATANGVVERDLGERLRFSRSKSIVLLPLNVPGERRDSEFDSTLVDKKQEKKDRSKALQIEKVRLDFESAISKSSIRALLTSSYINYENMHSTLTLFGGIVSNYLPLSSTTKEKLYKGPRNPSCMVVLEGLNKSGALSRQVNER